MIDNISAVHAPANKAEEAIRGILTTALEAGGIHYWAQVRRIIRDTDWGTVTFEVKSKEATGLDPQFDEWLSVDVIKAQQAITKILSGDVKVARDIVAQFVGVAQDDDDHDAIGADVVVQVAVFGQIIFG